MLMSNSGNFGWYVKWNWDISVWSDQNIRDQLWRWSTLTGPFISVGLKCPFPFDKNCCPQYCSFVSCLHKRAVACVGFMQPQSTVSSARGISKIFNRNLLNWNRPLFWKKKKQSPRQKKDDMNQSFFYFIQCHAARNQISAWADCWKRS